MLLPPPSPMITSGLKARAAATHSRTNSTPGSGVTLSKSRTSRPPAVSGSVVCASKPGLHQNRIGDDERALRTESFARVAEVNAHRVPAEEQAPAEEKDQVRMGADPECGMRNAESEP